MSGKLRTRFTLYSVILSVTVMTIFLTGCAGKPFGHPPGDRVASCEGKVRLTSGTTKFRLDVYRQDDEEVKLYLSMPGRGVRYGTVSEISYEDGVFRIEMERPKRVYEGTIVGDGMKLSGRWEGISGVLNIKFDD